MNSSRVTVYKNGRPSSGHRVVLEYDGFVNVGQTQPVYTDQNGVADISHASSGMATIYVDGSRKGKMNTPGSGRIDL